jgi:hypothetical protein
MSSRKAGRLLLTLYIGAYLCLLVPLHLHHHTADFSSQHNLEQSGAERVRAPHDSDTCPVCQLTSGLIDLPTQYTLTSFLAPVYKLADVEICSPLLVDQPRPSPRAPPVIA